MDMKKYFNMVVDTEYYGNICFRCIGIYDIDALIKEDKFIELSEKYFPFIYFSSNSLCAEILEYSEKHHEETAWALFLPLHEDNQNWKPEPHNTYYEHWIKKKQELPIGVKNKNTINKIIKWQQAGQGLFTPKYLDNLKSIEELKEIFDEIILSRNIASSLIA